MSNTQEFDHNVHVTLVTSVDWKVGTRLRLKHAPQYEFVVMEITSWHAYNCAVWSEEKGFEVTFVPHYHLRDADKEDWTTSMTDAHADQYEVIPEGEANG